MRQTKLTREQMRQWNNHDRQQLVQHEQQRPMYIEGGDDQRIERRTHEKKRMGESGIAAQDLFCCDLIIPIVARIIQIEGGTVYRAGVSDAQRQTQQNNRRQCEARHVSPSVCNDKA